MAGSLPLRRFASGETEAAQNAVGNGAGTLQPPQMRTRRGRELGTGSAGPSFGCREAAS